MSAHSTVILGSGQLGLAIMDELVARGQPVTLVNRRGKAPEPLPAGVRVAAGDVTRPDEVAALCDGARAVFACAQPDYTRWPEEFPAINEGILGGVARTGAKLVFGDNLYMYGPTGGKPVHEGLPYAATGRKGRTRAQMAERLLAAHRAGQLPVTIGRASDFYGPRVHRSMVGDTFWQAAMAGKPVGLIGNLDLPHTFTYIRDFARGLVVLSERDEALGQAWHVPNAPTITTREWAGLAAEALGQPVKLRSAGRWLIRLMGLFSPLMREFAEITYEFEEPYIVDHSRFEAAFGNTATPHAEALRETAAWWRAQASRAATQAS